MTIRTLIVDDEELARERIRTLLADEADFGVVGECVNGQQAVEAIDRLRPDLLFLDIQMPELDGFGALQAVGPERAPATVFVTAYDRYALQAFDSLALDYLLKPFTPDRFRQALERARRWIQGGEAKALRLDLARLLERVGRRYAERLMIRDRGRIAFVRVEEIDWVEAQGNYVGLHVGRETHLLRSSMKDLVQQLDPAKFLRIHRSTIVNLDAVREMQPLFHGEYRVTLRDGTELTSGRGFRRTLENL